MKSEKIKIYYVLIPLLLQFATVPMIGDIDKAGKIYLFSFFVISSLFLLSKSITKLKISPVVFILTFLWFLFFLGGMNSIHPPWAYLHLGIFSVLIIFLILFTHISFKFEDFFNLFVDGLMVAGVISSALGLYEYFHFSFLGRSHSMLIPYLLPPDSSERVTGIYGQPNLFAVFLTVVILAFFIRFIHLDSINKSRTFLFLKFIPFLLVSLVFFQTGSRAGLLSVTIILSLLSWLVASGRYLFYDVQGKKQFIKLIICFLVSFVIYVVLDYFSIKSNRSIMETVGISADARFIFWTSAVLIFFDYPWSGVGLGNFQFLQNEYGLQSHGLLGFVPYEAMGNTNWAHNEILQLLSEGGILVFISVLILLLSFLFLIYKNFIQNKSNISHRFLFSHLFLLPFILQSFFSWPFRHPPLLILFFCVFGILLSQYRLLSFNLSKNFIYSIRGFSVIVIVILFFLFIQEIKIGQIKKSLSSGNDLEDVRPLFESMVENRYSQYRVLHNGTPYFVREAMAQENNELASWILPYCRQLAELEGARWQWFNMAKIYLKLGRENEAREAILKTIDLMPSDDMTWSFLHYLNMLEASRETGRPLEYFWPKGKAMEFNTMELIHD